MTQDAGGVGGATVRLPPSTARLGRSLRGLASQERMVLADPGLTHLGKGVPTSSSYLSASGRGPTSERAHLTWGLCWDTVRIAYGERCQVCDLQEEV